MKTIEVVEFLQFWPLVLDCDQAAMERGDQLPVKNPPPKNESILYGSRFELPPALARELMLRRIVKAVGVGYDEQNDEAAA